MNTHSRQYKPDIYEASGDEHFRYLLGQRGNKMLVAFGSNPSTADSIKSDATITRVIRTAEKNCFDGWLMINVCSQRATNPKKVSVKPFMNEHQNNIKIVQKILKTCPDYACLGAWGNLIELRDYFKPCMKELVRMADLVGRPWFCFGLTAKGHPKHPLYVGYNQFQPFDICDYLSQPCAI